MNRDTIFRQNFGCRIRLNFWKIQKIGTWRKKVISTSALLKICLQNCHTWKICQICHKNIYIFRKLANFFENYLGNSPLRTVRFFLLSIHSISLRGMLPLNMLVEYMYFSQNTTTKAYIIGAKIIEVGFFGACPKIDVPANDKYMITPPIHNVQFTWLSLYVTEPYLEFVCQHPFCAPQNMSAWAKTEKNYKKLYILLIVHVLYEGWNNTTIDFFRNTSFWNFWLLVWILVSTVTLAVESLQSIHVLYYLELLWPCK